MGFSLVVKSEGYSTCGAQASNIGGFSCCRARALEHMGLSSCSSWLYITGSVVVAHRHSCSEACGLFPDQGWNSCLALWQVDCLPLSHQWSSTYFLTGNPFSSFLPLLPTHFLPSNFLIETRLEMSVILGKDCYSRKVRRKKSQFSLLNIKSGCWNWWLGVTRRSAGGRQTQDWN